MRRGTSEPNFEISLTKLTRAHSTNKAKAYYSDASEAGPASLSAVPVVVGTVVQDDLLSPLKVGQPVQVTKAGQWIDELARVKKVHADGTYDVAVFSKFHSDTGSLKEDFVLTNKPYPDEVKPAPPSVAARYEALASKPPDIFDPYKVQVVRDVGGREEWGMIEINRPGWRWEETVRVRRPQTGSLEWWLSSPTSRRFVETVPGAEEKNQERLLDLIQSSTRWRGLDHADVYCNGRKLTEMHLFRVHGIMCAGKPLVVIAHGQQYDQERWAPIAEKSPSDDSCCVIS